MEPFIALMRRYCVDYVARHDFSQLESLMEEDYVLRMGDHELVGREGPYATAARIQMEQQLPNLVLTPHEFITNGDRLAMRFSEHGAAPGKGGAQASWGGVSLYRWTGKRLTVCEVEEDYYARRRQYESGVPDPVDGPAVAPWDVIAQPANMETERAARSWLDRGALPSAQIHFDDAWLPSRAHQEVLDHDSVEIIDLFSAGDRVAFRAKQLGRLRQDFMPGSGGEPVWLHMAGIVTVHGGAVGQGRVIRDRIGLARRLSGQTVTPA